MAAYANMRTNIVLNIFCTSLFKFFFTSFNKYMNQHSYVVRLYNIIQIYRSLRAVFHHEILFIITGIT